MKNSTDTIGNRTRDLPACSAVPQPTVLPLFYITCWKEHSRWGSFVFQFGKMLMRDGISFVIIRQGKRLFCSPKRPDRRRGRHNRLFSGNRGYLPGVNRPGREVKLRSPSNAEAKNEWSYTSTPAKCLREVDRGNFTCSPFRQLMFGYWPGRNGDDIKRCSQHVSHKRNKNFDPLAATLVKTTWEICWEQVKSV
jgi:hypothetical protein